MANNIKDIDTLQFNPHWLRNALTCLAETAAYAGCLRIAMLPAPCTSHHWWMWGASGLVFYCIIVSLIPNAAYQRTARRDQVTASAMKSALAFILLTIIATALTAHTHISLSFWGKSFGSLAVVLTAERLITNTWFINYCSRNAHKEHALLICHDEDAAWMQQQLCHNTYGLQITRLIPPANTDPLFQASRLTDALEEQLQAHPEISALYYSPTAMLPAEIENAARCASQHNVVCHTLPLQVFQLNQPMRLQCRGNICVTSPARLPLSHLGWQLVKRLTDIAVSLLVLLSVFPVFALIATILIKRQSPGPILSIKKMCGMNGKTFQCLTFRTRHTEAAPSFLSGEDDLGCFPFGKFLMRTKLELLPQFICVLKGSMTLIGSQMMSPDKLEDYRRQQKQLFAENYRLKAGLTTHIQDKQEGSSVQADVWYCRNWGFWLDVRIMLLRLGTLLRQRKSATINYI